MNTEISIFVDKDVYDKFCIALQLSTEDDAKVMEKFLKTPETEYGYGKK